MDGPLWGVTLIWPQRTKVIMKVFRTKVIVGTFNSTTTSPVEDESPQSLSLLSEHEGSGHSREHLELFVVRFYLLQGEVGNNLSAEARVTKNPSACQQCWPESFCKSGKFLRQVHYWLKNFRILCNTKYPDNMQSVRMNWKVSGQSKKCPDNLENVSG